MTMVFSQLRSFHAVAEHGGFTAAAKALGIGQPTVTTQVKELEQRYGVELVLRQGRRVTLTEAGTALFAISRRIMTLHEEAEELLASSGRLQFGEFKLAAVGPFHATEMVASFLHRYPDIKVSVLLGNSELTLTRVLELQADIGILAHAVDDPRVHTVTFSTHEVVFFMNEEHPWYGRESVSIGEVEGQSLILREIGSTTRRAFEAAAGKANVPVTPFLEIGSREGVWKAVERGLGIGVVADFEFVQHPRLKTVRIADAKVRTEYRLACLKERQHSSKIRAFFESVTAGGRQGALPAT
ncbi:MAG: LysR substrate-binding domain-containing protein [Hyphomicrobiaceae bacterium]